MIFFCPQRKQVDPEELSNFPYGYPASRQHFQDSIPWRREGEMTPWWVGGSQKSLQSTSWTWVGIITDGYYFR